MPKSIVVMARSTCRKTRNVDLEGVKGLLKGLGSEATGANPASFVDASLVQELEREGFFQQTRR